MSEDNSTPRKDGITKKFHLCSLSFKRSKGFSGSQKDIVFEIEAFIRQKKLEGKGFLLDRHAGRTKGDSRKMFMSRFTISHLQGERVIKASLILIKNESEGFRFKPEGSFDLKDFASLGKGDLTTTTNFYIKFDARPLVICVEFNASGPRVSDVEYYLRKIANEELKIATQTGIEHYMNISLEQAMRDMEEVLSFEVGSSPLMIEKADGDLKKKFASTIRALSDKIGGDSIRVLSYFSGKKDGGSDDLKKQRISLYKSILLAIKRYPSNIEAFDLFKLKYSDKEGNQQVLDLIKGKKVLEVEILPSTDFTNKTYYSLIKKRLDTFVQSLESASEN
jgi:hypothetical protein